MIERTNRSACAKTPDGVYDLGGSVKEWCRDWYGEYPGHRVADPLGPPTGNRRVVRGGSFNDERTMLRGSARESAYALDRSDTRYGFRVVWP